MSKEMYHCMCCNYFTDTSQCIRKHVTTDKHIKKASVEVYTCDTTKKTRVYVCLSCDKQFLSLSTKKRHQKECNKDNSVNVVNEKIEKPIQTSLPNDITMLITKLINENNELKQGQTKLMDKLVDKLLEQQQTNNKTHAEQFNAMQQTINATVRESLDTIKTTVEKNTNVAMKSMNLIKYAAINLKNAPPLKTLKKVQIYGILGYNGNDNILSDKQKEEENEKFIKIVAGRHENKDLAQFLGQMIVTYFKKQSTNEKNEFDVELSPLWSVDVVRLSFIIMQPVNKQGEKEWIKDKSGKLFTQMVTTPMLETLDSIIRTFLDYKLKWEKKIKNLSIEQMDYLIDIRQKCAEIMNDIKYNKLNRPILRHVAPAFQFNNYLKTDTKNWKQLQNK